ncbi:MAG: hypothetical protein K5864_00380 [Bacteroidales bacterium]|nr:hypothetical protein [Bacteroidales bacterium]
MKKLIDRMLCVAILVACCTGSLSAQTSDEGENYYSNPKKGIKAQAPKRYVDNSIEQKSDDLIVELTGENMVPDSSVADSTKGFEPAYYYDYAYTARINRFHRGMHWGYYDDFYTDIFWYTGMPYFWGTSIYYGWNPWLYSWGSFYPYYGWYYYDWWYDPWFSPWYGGMWYYPCHYYGYGSAWYGDYAHNSYVGPYGYMGNTGRGAYYPTSRNSGGKALSGRTQPTLGSSTVRRGGVDINGGGRGTMGHVSGVQAAGRGASSGRTSTASTGSSTRSGGYDKPASVAQNHGAQTYGRTSNGSQQNYGNSGRSTSYSNSSVSTTSRGGNNNTSYRQSNSSRYSNSDSYRSTSNTSRSSYNSNSSSRSSIGSSSSHSSGGGFSGSRSSGGGSHSSGGGSHSSRR